jgi:hypothetical protein
MKELSTALAKAQTSILVAGRNSKNPHFKAYYADLESIWDACRKPLTDNGLSVTQMIGVSVDGKPTITTMLLHTSGEYLSTTALLPVQKNGPQELGSCIKYMRRYCLAAIVGVVDGEDDDGEAAEGRRSGAANTKPSAPSTTAAPMPKNTTSELDYPEPPPIPPHGAPPRPLSEAQIKRLYAIANKRNWSPKIIQGYVHETYGTKVSELSRTNYDKVCTFFESTQCTDMYRDRYQTYEPVSGGVKAALENEIRKQAANQPPPHVDEEIPF